MKRLFLIVPLLGCQDFGEVSAESEESSSSSTTDDVMMSSSTAMSSSSSTSSSSSSSSSGEEDSDSSDDEGSTSSSSSSSSSSSGSGDPALWLPFDDGSYVDAISGEEASPVGNMAFVQNSASFDGASYIDASYFAQSYRDAERLTVSLSLRSTDRTGNRALLSLGNTGETVEDNSFHILAADGQIQIVTETGSGIDHISELGALPDDDEWHDIILVFEGDTVSRWIDGDDPVSSTYTPAQTNCDRFLVGSSWNGWGWSGEIDELKIWID